MCIPGTAMSRYINFYTDFAFKKFFGTEANKEFLISFLNALLELEGEKEIADLTYLNTEQLGFSNNERRAVYDVYCTTKEGERFIVRCKRQNKKILGIEPCTTPHLPFKIKVRRVQKTIPFIGIINCLLCMW